MSSKKKIKEDFENRKDVRYGTHDRPGPSDDKIDDLDDMVNMTPVVAANQMSTQLSYERPPIEDEEFLPSGHNELGRSMQASAEQVPAEQITYFYRQLLKLIDKVVEKQNDYEQEEKIEESTKMSTRTIKFKNREQLLAVSNEIIRQFLKEEDEHIDQSIPMGKPRKPSGMSLPVSKAKMDDPTSVNFYKKLTGNKPVPWKELAKTTGKGLSTVRQLNRAGQVRMMSMIEALSRRVEAKIKVSTSDEQRYLNEFEKLFNEEIQGLVEAAENAFWVGFEELKSSKSDIDKKLVQLIYTQADKSDGDMFGTAIFQQFFVDNFIQSEMSDLTKQQERKVLKVAEDLGWDPSSTAIKDTLIYFMTGRTNSEDNLRKKLAVEYVKSGRLGTNESVKRNNQIRQIIEEAFGDWDEETDKWDDEDDQYGHLNIVDDPDGGFSGGDEADDFLRQNDPDYGKEEQDTISDEEDLGVSAEQDEVEEAIDELIAAVTKAVAEYTIDMFDNDKIWNAQNLPEPIPEVSANQIRKSVKGLLSKSF